MISIIVPIYRVEPYLSRSIESIINQSYKELEILLVDDGSPDGCGTICDTYAEKDTRITVLHQANAGVSAARNAGLAAAKGEYIGFVDPDDFVDPNMYLDMLHAIESENADLAICGYNYADEKGNVDAKRLYRISDNEILTQKQLMSCMSDMPPTVRLGVVTKLFRKELLHDLQFTEGLHSAEDVLFLTEYVLRTEKAVFVHKPLYLNTVRVGSATHGGLKINSLADSITVHDKMYKTIVEAYPELRNHSLAFLLDVCMLKYNEATRRLPELSQTEQKELIPHLRKMRWHIRKRGWQALMDSEIYWKTRVRYLLC